MKALSIEKEKYESYMTVENVCQYLVATKETVYRGIKKNSLQLTASASAGCFAFLKLTSGLNPAKRRNEKCDMAKITVNDASISIILY